MTIISHAYGHIFQNRRFDAYQDACAQNGFEPDPDSFFCLNDIQLDETLLAEILHRYRQKECTALFVDQLTQANLVRVYFAQNGLPVGRDFSIIAIERGTEQTPQEGGITSIVLPDYEYGVQAAQMMLRALEDPSLEYMDVKCKFELRDRHSVVRL